MGISAGGSGGEIREKKDKRDIDLDDERFAMKGYEHQTQYYETDQMGIIHHSNYIRWFESARIWYMKEIGVDYADMERQGIISPVL